MIIIKRLYKNVGPEIIILSLLALFFQGYKLINNMYFSAEFGHNLLAVKNAILDGSLPLVGPPTSHPWLSFGPLYYWIMMPVMYLSGFNPIFAKCFGVLVGTSVVFVNFLVVRHIFRDKRIALLSSYFIAASPLIINYSRNARFYYLVALMFYPFVWTLYKIYGGNKKYLFWGGLVYSVYFHFHYTPVFFAPVILIVFWLSRKRFVFIDYAKYVAGLLFPFIPFLIHDLKNGMQMSKNILLWVPYRIAGFLGLYPKNNVTSEIMSDNLSVFSEFVGSSFSLNSSLWNTIAIVFILLIIFTLIYTAGKVNKRNFGYFIFSLMGLFGVLAVFIHGSAPVHYYLPIFTVPAVIFSYAVFSIFKSTYIRFFVFVAIYAMLFANIKSFSSSENYYKYEEAEGEYKYSTVYQVSEKIVKNAAGEPFALSRVGKNDEFEGDYAQNYQYLMWLLGNEPVDYAKLRYTIYEDTERLFNKGGSNIFWIGDIAVSREKL